MLGGAYNEGRDSPVPCSRGLVLTISVSESVVERDVECLIMPVGCCIDFCVLWQRLHEDREAKLRSLTASISRSQAQRTAPVRHTKLAYVYSDAKPPREVLRRQMKNRTEMSRSPAANGKRTAFAASVTSDAASPKKRHSTPVPTSSQGRAESPSQLKGPCISVAVNSSQAA